MIQKLFNWLFGKKITSSIAGIVIGAATGVGVAASQGNLTKEGLVGGAIAGGVAALVGAGGRAHGDH